MEDTALISWKWESLLARSQVRMVQFIHQSQVQCLIGSQCHMVHSWEKHTLKDSSLLDSLKGLPLVSLTECLLLLLIHLTLFHQLSSRTLSLSTAMPTQWLTFGIHLHHGPKFRIAVSGHAQLLIMWLSNSQDLNGLVLQFLFLMNLQISQISLWFQRMMVSLHTWLTASFRRNGMPICAKIHLTFQWLVLRVLI